MGECPFSEGEDLVGVYGVDEGIAAWMVELAVVDLVLDGGRPSQGGYDGPGPPSPA